MGVGSRQHRELARVRPPTSQKIADDMIRFHARIDLQITEHRGSEQRTRRGQRSVRLLEQRGARRMPSLSRDAATFLEE
jgi:hypothetical protein